MDHHSQIYLILMKNKGFKAREVIRIMRIPIPTNCLLVFRGHKKSNSSFDSFYLI